jgi:hydrogenase expression/formation protein HypC
MCLAAPSRVVALDGLMAEVESFGERRMVNLMLLEEEVALGDYLLIQAGGFASEKVEKEKAEEALRLMQELISQPLTAETSRRW